MSERPQERGRVPPEEASEGALTPYQQLVEGNASRRLERAEARVEKLEQRAGVLERDLEQQRMAHAEEIEQHRRALEISQLGVLRLGRRKVALEKALREIDQVGDYLSSKIARAALASPGGSPPTQEA